MEEKTQYNHSKDKDKYVPPKEALNLFPVWRDTLRDWEVSGEIKAKKTPGGHRRYEVESLIAKKEKEEADDRKKVIVKPRFRNLSLTRRLDRFVHGVTDDKHQLEASTTKLVELLLSESEIVKASNGEYLLLELVPCTEVERKESRRVVTSVPITDKTFENLSILREVLNMHASTALRLIHLLGV